MSHETENGKPEEYTEVLKRFIQPKFEKALKSYMHADETSPKWRAFSDMVERDASEQLAREESDGKKKPDTKLDSGFMKILLSGKVKVQSTEASVR
jgi:hypothetical protein